MKLQNPSLILRFLGNDLEPGHSTEQTIGAEYLIFGSFDLRFQRLNGLKSSSDQIGFKLDRSCPAIEDINATDGDIEAVLMDGEETIFTGFLGTNHSWDVTDHGEQPLNATLESKGTRLLNKPFIETGKHFFDCAASAAVYSIVHPLGIEIREGDERLLLQPVQMEVDAGKTCRDLLDLLFYECNAVYYFNNIGELCVMPITADTEGAPVFDKSNLIMKAKKVVSMSKQLRTYCGARVAYKELGKASNYLVYRNTTGQGSGVPYCNLVIPAGNYFDGAEIYTAAQWSEATADEFREPTLIGAVNADSESSIVGSGEIVNIENLRKETDLPPTITFQAEVAGGPYFKMLAHNTGLASAAILRLDLYADITYVKSNGVIRTQVEGNADGKSILEEELSWIHDKANATLHANLLAQYYRAASSSYTFYSRENIPLGSVIRLREDVFSGLDVYVLVTTRQTTDKDDINTYTAVGITTFNLDEDAYHGTSESGKQSGAQGPKGDPGEAVEVQYAIGSSFIYPPSDEMLWNSQPMKWNDELMTWSSGLWGDDVPEPERGTYIWMRTRVGSAPWQYTRLTGTTSWDPEDLGICTTACPTSSQSGLGLIPGDYFVAGATFTDPVDGNEYAAGCAYVYNGSAWTDMNIDSVVNAKKTLSLLSDIISSEFQIPQSAAQNSLWKWVKNLAALDALIVNLFTQHITVLENGCIHSEYYDDDGNPKASATISKVGSNFSVALDADIFLEACGYSFGTYTWIADDSEPPYWDRATGNPLSSKTQDGMLDYGITITGTPGRYNEITVTVAPVAAKGFWLGANGLLKCENAEVHGDIMADSFAFGNVGLKWGYLEISSTTTIDLITDYGMTYDDMVTIQASWIGSDDNPFAFPSFSFCLSDGVRGLYNEALLVNTNGVKIYYVRGLQYGAVGGIRVETSRAVKLFIQAFHKRS